jgi:hypothetical protein
MLDDHLDDLLNSGRAFIADEKPTIQIKGKMDDQENINEKEIISIIDQIIIDVENLDYTAIYELIEKLANMDSVIITSLLRGFLLEAHRKAEDNAKDMEDITC